MGEHRSLDQQELGISLLIVATGLFLSLPLLRFGPLLLAHDAFQHLSWYVKFSEQFWSGDLYPRWVTGLNAGLGSPIFFCYGPAAFFLPTLLRPIFQHSFTGLHELFEFDLAFALVLIASGFSAYLWIKTLTNRWVAVTAAILYMAAPYHLIGDIYFRYAAAEGLAFVAMPLMMYFSIGLRRGGTQALAGWAASYALLIASHLFTALIFSPVPVLYLLLMERGPSTRKAVARLALAVILGIGLSAFYLFPALAHQKNIPAKRLTEEALYYYENNFLRGGSASLAQGLQTRDFKWYAALFVLMTFPPIVCGLILSLTNGGEELKREAVFWALIAAGSLFMMLPWSRPLWQLLPLLQDIQFPWRFSTLLTLAAIPSIALGMFALRRPLSFRQRIVAGISLLVVLSWTVPIARLSHLYGGHRQYSDGELRLVRIGGDNLRHVWARWTDPRLLTYPSMTEMVRTLPQAKPLQPSGEVSVSDWRPRRIRLQVNSPDGTWVVLRQFYYPGWSAQVVGGGQLPVQPSTPEGLIKFWVPGGDYEVLVRLNGGVMEKIGTWMSAATLLICLALIVTAKTGSPRVLGERQ